MNLGANLSKNSPTNLVWNLNKFSSIVQLCDIDMYICYMCFFWQIIATSHGVTYHIVSIFFGGEALHYDIQTEMVNFKVWPSKVTVPNNHRKVTWTRQGPMIFVLRYFGGLSVTVVRWWFQIFLIFIPIWGNDPI